MLVRWPVQGLRDWRLLGLTPEELAGGAGGLAQWGVELWLHLVAGNNNCYKGSLLGVQNLVITHVCVIIKCLSGFIRKSARS